MSRYLGHCARRLDILPATAGRLARGLSLPRSATIPPSRRIDHSQKGPGLPIRTIHMAPEPPNNTSIFIKTEATPNQDCIKFLPGLPVMQGEGLHAEFLDWNSTKSSPLARQIFQIPGVTSVFYGPNFVTVSKRADMAWPLLKPEIFSCIMNYFSAGSPLFIEGEEVALDAQGGGGSNMAILDTDSETVAMIKELLDTRVRPALQEDGGDVEFRSFGEDTDGIVRLRLKGSCRGCDSSSVTLKSGVERMLMHYIPEVLGVEQILDQHEPGGIGMAMAERQREDALGFSP